MSEVANSLSDYVLAEAKRMAQDESNVTAWWAAFLNWSRGSEAITVLQEAAAVQYGKKIASDLICLHTAFRNRNGSSNSPTAR